MIPKFDLHITKFAYKMSNSVDKSEEAYFQLQKCKIFRGMIKLSMKITLFKKSAKNELILYAIIM